jgi:hypothetical protein
MTSKIILVTLMTFSISLSSVAFAEGEDKETVRNYKRYKSFAAPKKERLNDKWSDFKKRTNWDNLSDKERDRLKKKVYDKGR